jgi:predicted RNase H-like nuclease (RuvC/YqgF family)
MKPEVLKQMVKIEKGRRAEMEKMRLQQQNMPSISITRPDGVTQTLTMEQIIQLLQHQEEQINQLNHLLKGKETEINMLNSISLSGPDGVQHKLNIEQVVSILQQQQAKIGELNTTIIAKDVEIENLKKTPVSLC